MDRYLVLCDCDGDQQPRAIAFIDDDRTNGGRIALTPNVGLDLRRSVEFASNRRGDNRTPVRLSCDGCGMDIARITDATAGDIIDKIAPQQDQLRIVQWPPYEVLPEGNAVLGGRNRFVINFGAFCRINSKLR